MNPSYDSSIPEIGAIQSLKVLIRKRRLVFMLAKNDLVSRYKKTVLGILWAQLNPLLTTSVIYFVFGRFFNQSTSLKDGYAVYVYTGILFQILLLSGITQAGQSLAGNAALLLKTRTSPIIFSFSSALGNILNFLIGFTLLIPLAFLTQTRLSLRILLLPLLLLLLTFFLTGIGMFLSGFYIRFDDFSYLMGAAMMIAAYLCPIFYPIEILSDKLRLIVEFNPLTSWVIVIRWMCFADAYVSSYNLFVVFFSQAIVLALGITWVRKRWNHYMVLL